jgi:ribosomal protein S12 methylthiotransferase accessory factor
LRIAEKTGRSKVDGIDRVVSAAETISRVTRIAGTLGVTRLADITGLDRIGIPVYSSVVPKSDDGISVYNGKGSRRVDAQAGALMEAIERQTALKARLPYIEGSYAELSRTRRVLDPKSINQKLAASYSDEKTYAWVEGFDIVAGEACWVPAKFAGYLWDELPHPSCFDSNDTSGLAAGNSREEAMCHALCELAERDAWTMAELGAHQLPRQRRALAHGVARRDGPDDLELFPCLDVDFGDAELEELLAKYHRAGLFPVMRDITSELGVPTFFASAADEQLPGFPMAHSGLGAHPNAKVALRRALTEMAQSRCVDIQGVREDLLPPDAAPTEFSLHMRRVSAINRDTYYLGESVRRRKLRDVASRAFDSIEADTAFLLDRFAACGMRQVIVVDFTPEAEDYSVVRVIVPGIEFWATDQGRLGPRAVAYWKAHA